MNGSPDYWRRRAALQQRSDQLRDRLVAHSVALQPVWTAIDGSHLVGRWLARHPWLSVSLLTLMVWRRPRSAWQWAMKGWTGWRLFMRMKRLWAALRA